MTNNMTFEPLDSHEKGYIEHVLFLEDEIAKLKDENSKLGKELNNERIKSRVFRNAAELLFK